ncbi:MAG: GGDEF domain-containing protein [Treponema sp.]|nr:GGDEF domain-containing protein [Candidatus Treponema equifaecale]
MSFALDSVNISQLESVVHILNQCSDAFIFVFDLVADTIFISYTAEKFFNIDSERIENATAKITRIVQVEDRSFFVNELDQVKALKKSELNMEFRLHNKSGKPIWMILRAKLIPTEIDNRKILLGQVSIAKDEDKTDIITGLPTENQLRNDFATTWTKKQSVSGFILKIDVDNLGAINEHYGSMTGDVILSKIGDCCRKVCFGQAKAYKLSEDEFICMNLTGKNAQNAQKLYQDLKREISESGRGAAPGSDAVFTVSGGAIAFMNDNSQLEDLLKKANYTVAQAKKKGRNNLVTFNSVAYSAHLRDVDLQEKLRESIKNDFKGFELYFQPFVDAHNIYLDSDCTVLNVIGAESLIRWSCPEYGRLTPDEFIPILERTGLIVSVGRWILRTAFAQCREWNKVQKDFAISVNLSYIQVQKSDVIRDIETALLVSEVDPKNVTIELTESGYIDNGEQLQQLTESLSNLGLNVDIDDFGTGYSNLRYLQYLKAHTLKLDYTFVQKATGGDDGDRKIIKHITQMAHELGMNVCMEGVEHADDVDKLLIYFPDKFQGYFFGRPCNAVDFREHHIRPDSRLDVYEKTKL